MEAADTSDSWAWLREAGVSAAEWIQQHKDELDVFGVWGSVANACSEARLYAPPDEEAWRRIDQASQEEVSADELERLILELYGPGGDAHQTLRAELTGATLLSERQGELGEVLDSLAENRNYVAVCGTLPLVEFVLAEAAGEWKQPPKQPINDRLDETDAFSDEDEIELMVYASAVELVQSEIPGVWEYRDFEPGAVTDELNRHLVLHGMARGWDDPGNATRAVLLLAATCRVAVPLLAPDE